VVVPLILMLQLLPRIHIAGEFMQSAEAEPRETTRAMVRE
jgi:hypothetical protein